MNNIKKKLEWIEKINIDEPASSQVNAPSLKDLTDLLNMTSLQLADDDDGSYTPFSDQSYCIPYLTVPLEEALLCYFFSMYESAGTAQQKKIRNAVILRAEWSSPPHIIKTLIRFHYVSLSTELIKRVFSPSIHSCITIAKIMLEEKIVKPDWIDIMWNAPNRNAPPDPFELVAYPFMIEARKKWSIELEEILNKLKNQ